MQTLQSNSRLTLVLLLSTLALACLPCQTGSPVIPTPVRTVPVSTHDAETLVSRLAGGLVVDRDGCFVLRVSEEELTSYVALRMDESVANPQIVLTNGKIYLYGTLVSPIEAPIAAIASVETQEDQVQITVESVALAGFPIPDTFVESFARQIADFLTYAGARENLAITKIEITEGKLIIRGSKVIS